MGLFRKRCRTCGFDSRAPDPHAQASAKNVAAYGTVLGEPLRKDERVLYCAPVVGSRGRRSPRGIVVTTERVMSLGPGAEVEGMPFGDLIDVDRFSGLEEPSLDVGSAAGAAIAALSIAAAAIGDALEQTPSRRAKLSPGFWAGRVVLKGDSGREVIIDTPKAPELGPFVAHCLWWANARTTLPTVSYPE